LLTRSAQQFRVYRHHVLFTCKNFQKTIGLLSQTYSESTLTIHIGPVIIQHATLVNILMKQPRKIVVCSHPRSRRKLDNRCSALRGSSVIFPPKAAKVCTRQRHQPTQTMLAAIDRNRVVFRMLGIVLFSSCWKVVSSSESKYSRPISVVLNTLLFV